MSSAQDSGTSPAGQDAGEPDAAAHETVLEPGASGPAHPSSGMGTGIPVIDKAAYTRIDQDSSARNGLPDHVDGTGLLGSILHTVESRQASGKLARKWFPRSGQGEFIPVDRDPVALIEAQNAQRLQELVPLRYERMSASPFTFYRGTAGLMAHDLAQQRDTGVQVVLCGDAHLSNFGLYASPERSLVFDLNDFDEAAPGPWEWDVKRLVTSVVIGGQDIGLPTDKVRKAAQHAARAYRTGLNRLFTLNALDRYYYRVDEEYMRTSLDSQTLALFEAAAKKAAKRTSDRFVSKSMRRDETGRMRFVETPPVLVHLPKGDERELLELALSYLRTVRPDIAMMLSTHVVSDVAMRVVGVGSVGTRCFVVALTGPDDDRLVLQIKEALPSVISTYAPPAADEATLIPADATDGQRVVAYQQVLQAVSDPFLGHFQADGKHYYVRQFRDMKGSLDVSTMSAKQYAGYAAKCGLLLARAHSQSPAAPWISGYLGESEIFDAAITDWSFAYAQQSLADYERFVGATGPGQS